MIPGGALRATVATAACVDIVASEGNANVKAEETEQGSKRLDKFLLMERILVLQSLLIYFSCCDYLPPSYKCISRGACAKRLEDISYLGVDQHLGEKVQICSQSQHYL
jgi:hypothetical protein